MEQKKEDRRIRITKQAIRESLVELMQEHPITKISVKMICETADINRSTFYAHYKDQYSLLYSVQQEIITDVKKKIFSAHFFRVSDDVVQILVQVLEFGKTNAPLLKVLLSENGDSGFQNELMQLAQEKIMEQFTGDKSLQPHVMQYLKHFALSGMLGIMRHWLEGDCADAPEIVAELMIQLLINGFSGFYSTEHQAPPRNGTWRN